MLPCGYFMGVIAIPLYGVGFWAVAQMLAPKAPRAGLVVLVSGVIMAVLGVLFMVLPGYLLRLRSGPAL